MDRRDAASHHKIALNHQSLVITYISKCTKKGNLFAVHFLAALLFYCPCPILGVYFARHANQFPVRQGTAFFRFKGFGMLQ